MGRAVMNAILATLLWGLAGCGDVPVEGAADADSGAQIDAVDAVDAAVDSGAAPAPDTRAAAQADAGAADAAEADTRAAPDTAGAPDTYATVDEPDSDHVADLPPLIVALHDQAVAQGETLALDVTLVDEDPGAVTLSAAVSDDRLLPATAIALAGAGAGRTLTLAPPGDVQGEAVVTITATDAAGQSGSVAFRVRVWLASGWTGVLQWGLASDDGGEGVAVDEQGTSYVSGWDLGPNGRYEGRVAAFDKDGAPLWTVKRPSVYDHMSRQLAYSPLTDRLYVAEQSKTIPNSNAQVAILAALDPFDGGETWADTIDYLDGGPDFTVGARVRVDPTGFVFFAGSYKRLAPAGGWETGTFLARYDDLHPAPAGGVVDHVGPFPYAGGGFGDSHITNALPAADGGFYALGQTPNAIGGEPVLGGSDIFLRRYDADGAITWTRRYGTAGEDYARGLARLADGRLAVGGATTGVMGEASAGGRDAVLLLLDPASGDVVWTKQFGTAGLDYLLEVVVMPDATLLLLGSENHAGTGAGATGTGFVRRVTVKTGDRLWHTPISAGPSGWVAPMDIALIGRDAMVVGRVRGSLGGQPALGGSDGFVLRVTGDGAIP